VTLWSSLPSPDIAAAVSRADRGHAGRGQEVGLVPVGAIEQHGPHLPVGTDAIVAAALCADAGELTGSLVLPPIALGVSYGHGTVLAGTLSLTPELLVATVHQYVRWAAVSGLRRLIFVNAHFGNAASLGVATDSVRLLAPGLRVGTIDWWAADAGILAEVTADGADIHANRAETAIMLAVAPDQVRMDRVADADDPDRTDGLVFRYTAPALSRNGVTGRPSLATAELGESLRRRVARAIADRVERGRTEEPPLGVAPAPGFPF
jgi:creatinine amidohydrolase